MKPPFKTVGLGEILWDMLPGGKQLGGAPANFAYMTSLLGDKGIVASRVGHDALGREALQAMEQLQLDTHCVQGDAQRPTGTAEVSVGHDGQPVFAITQPVAWDFLEWTPGLQELAAETDAVCFGSLAQRSSTSRATILRFLEGVPERTIKVFDVNLRQPFYTAEVLFESFKRSNLVKLNHEELPVVAGLLDLAFDTDESCALRMLRAFGLNLVCVTRGARGSLLVTEREISAHQGFRVKVADTVGAGDAFTACLVNHYLRGDSLESTNEDASRFAAWVASQPGGTPVPGKRGLREELAKIS